MTNQRAEWALALYTVGKGSNMDQSENRIGWSTCPAYCDLSALYSIFCLALYTIFGLQMIHKSNCDFSTLFNILLLALFNNISIIYLPVCLPCCMSHFIHSYAEILGDLICISFVISAPSIHFTISPWIKQWWYIRHRYWITIGGQVRNRIGGGRNKNGDRCLLNNNIDQSDDISFHMSAWPIKRH